MSNRIFLYCFLACICVVSTATACSEDDGATAEVTPASGTSIGNDDSDDVPTLDSGDGTQSEREDAIRVPVPDLENPVTLEDTEFSLGPVEAASTDGLTSETGCDLLPKEHLSLMMGADPLTTYFGGCSVLVLPMGFQLQVVRFGPEAIDDLDALGMHAPREAITLTANGVEARGWLHRNNVFTDGPELVIATEEHTWFLTQMVNPSANGAPLPPNQLVEVGRVVLARLGTPATGATATDLEDGDTDAGNSQAPAAESSAGSQLSEADAIELGNWIASFRATQNDVVDRNVEVEALRAFMTDAEWARTPAGYADVQMRRETSGYTIETVEDPQLGSVVVLRDCLNEYYSALTPDVPSNIAEEVFVLERSGDSWLIRTSEFGRDDCPQLDE